MEDNQCIAWRAKARCSTLIDSKARFCDFCASLCVPSYLKYKKVEEKIRCWPQEESHALLLRYYARLQKAYNLRISFREKYIHPSAWDQGHNTYIENILERMKQCSSQLEYLAQKKDFVEEIVEEEIEEHEIISDIPSPKISKRKELPKEVDIVTPLDIVNIYVKDVAFSKFLVDKLYPLIMCIIVGLEEVEPYIRQSPLLTIDSIETVFRFDDGYLKYFCDINNDLLPYFRGLYEEYKERNHLVYRFYRMNETTYGLTFIRSTKPQVLSMHSLNDNKHSFELCDIHKLEENGNKDLYCSYHDRFSTNFSITFPSDIRTSKSIYRIMHFDISQGDSHVDKWARLMMIHVFSQMKTLPQRGIPIRVDDENQLVVFY